VHATYNRLTEPPPGLPARGRIVVLTMDPESKGMARQIDSFCRPPRISAESESGATDAFLAPGYNSYRRRVEEAEKKATAAASSTDASPILESIHAIGRRPDFAAAASGSRWLIISSDLLQHVKGGVEEKDNARLDVKKFSETAYGRDLKPDLQGVEVQVLYLNRQKKGGLQTAAHEEFWRTWFTASGAKTVTFTPVPE
jgi:hypothetical protein